MMEGATSVGSVQGVWVQGKGIECSMTGKWD